MLTRGYEGSATYEVTTKLFGRPCRLEENVVDVGATPSEVANSNPRRLFLHVVNEGVTNLRLAFSRERVVDHGILLAANGGSLTLVVDEDGEAVGYALYAAYPSGTGSVYVLELIAI